MTAIISRALESLEQRTGIQTACRRFFLEDIPASAGWPQVFGSVSLFLILIQMMTGILLSLNYAPTPGDAYSSVVYILRKIPAGRMMLGLHHWGASLLIVVVCLHMVQVFLYGAYKRPREVTWMAGVLLLLLTLSFGLTGYLLPWDNRAYWGTIVTTRIAAGVPFAGPVLTRLLGAGRGIGVVTFSRFYALHTLLLPFATVLLLFVHIYLVRRHGITVRSSSDNGRTQKFFPKQLFRDVCAVFVAFVLLFAAAAFFGVRLERIADPTDASYVPRPEWYFLFLFQLLKFFGGKLEVIGTVVLPSLAVVLLLALPFFPRLHARLFDRRAVSWATALLALSSWGALTVAAAWDTPRAKRSAGVPREAVVWAQIPPEEIAGVGYFRSLRCDGCHNLLTGNPKPGPNLASAGIRHPREWLIQHFNNESQPARGGTQSSGRLPLPELNALALFVANLKPESADMLTAISPHYIAGTQTYVVGGCGSCHKVNGMGGGIGPPLNGLANRRNESWVKEHFVAPQRLSPGSIMPPYRFRGDEEEALLDYLYSLPD